MKWISLPVLACYLSVLPTFVLADANETIAKWKLSQKNVKQVQVDFYQYRFDQTFRTFQLCRGSLNFTNPTSGQISYRNCNDQKKRQEFIRRGEKLVRKKLEEETIVWTANLVRFFDIKSKSYIETLQGSGIVSSDPLIPSISSLMPILPGNPDKKALTDWEYELIADHDDQIHLRAFPPKKLKDRFGTFELILIKADLSLYAIKQISSGGQTEVVTVFTGANKNPKTLPSFDMTPFKKYDSLE